MGLWVYGFGVYGFMGLGIYGFMGLGFGVYGLIVRFRVRGPMSYTYWGLVGNNGIYQIGIIFPYSLLASNCKPYTSPICS